MATRSPFVTPSDLQHVRKRADLAVQIEVGQRAAIAGLSFPDEGGLVAARGADVTIDAVDRHVDAGRRRTTWRAADCSSRAPASTCGSTRARTQTSPRILRSRARLPRTRSRRGRSRWRGIQRAVRRRDPRGGARKSQDLLASAMREGYYFLLFTFHFRAIVLQS